jgi:hypothetical protein
MSPRIGALLVVVLAAAPRALSGQVGPGAPAPHAFMTVADIGAASLGETDAPTPTAGFSSSDGFAEALRRATARYVAGGDDLQLALVLLAEPSAAGVPTSLPSSLFASLQQELWQTGLSEMPVTPYGRMFWNGFALIGGFEVGLLVLTMMMPKSFTGWEDDFFREGMGNLAEAWTNPPVWDTDHWFHNYVGHPYGGAIYYNTVRAQGATPFQSFLFSAAMSTWWEYVLEAVAERPSIQDLIITPVTGSLLGEFTHRWTLRMKRNGTTTLEKIVITIANPTHVVFRGYH